jgi:CheY-like chemotaxis protein
VLVVRAERPVLLVDDDAEIRQALAEVLTDEGFTVHVAQNGKEALEWLYKHTGPCVVLLDLMMPVMDGRTFLTVRSADPSLSKVPVLVISADAGCRELTKTHTVTGVFPKPLALDRLIAAIDGCA